MWLASEDDENWVGALEFSSRKEALEFGGASLGLALGEIFFICERIAPQIPPINTQALIRKVQDDAFHQVGDAIGGWLEHIDPVSKETLNLNLNKTFTDWLFLYDLLPHWFTYENVEIVASPGPGVLPC